MRPARSYIVRVYRKRARVAGVAEDVQSGERHVFSSLEDFAQWLRRPLALRKRDSMKVREPE